MRANEKIISQEEINDLKQLLADFGIINIDIPDFPTHSIMAAWQKRTIMDALENDTYIDLPANGSIYINRDEKPKTKKQKPTNKIMRLYFDKYKSGELSQVEIAKIIGVSKTTVI